MKHEKLKPIIVGAAAFVLGSCLLMTGCAEPYDWQISPINLDIHTELQANYLAEEDLSKDYNVARYAKGEEELSRPNPTELSFRVTPKKKDASAVLHYTVELSESKSMTNAKTYQTTDPSLELYNLKLDTYYYYRATAHFADGTTAVSPVKRFLSDDVAPRNLKVDGVSNVRDVGGWETTGGGRVKQGMIYRGGELNVAYSTTGAVNVTEEGKRVLLEDFGIRSEIDLRVYNNTYHETANIKESPLGADVKYYWCQVDSLTNPPNLLTHNLEPVRKVFELLADENNYPVYYHCRIGTDRTGMFAFMINGLCGVPYEDLCRDYLFSNFGNLDADNRKDGSSARDIARLLKEGYVDDIMNSEGDDLSEKIYNCLVNVGVKAEWLDNIIEIMTED